MAAKTHLDDPQWVSAQYKDASRFDARVGIYRFAKDPERWTEWLWKRIAFEPGERALEVGAGPGNLWRDNAARLPERTEVTVSDASEGMVDEARRRLAGIQGSFRFSRIDVQDIPEPDARFDVGIANHMLYHVPDRTKAIRELHRVLCVGGRLCVGTNEWTHMIELRELCHRCGLSGEMLPPERVRGVFDLETAADELSDVFDDVELVRRNDFLEITDSDALRAYAGSLSRRGPMEEAALDRIRDEAARAIERLGSFHVTVAIGLFRALRG